MCSAPGNAQVPSTCQTGTVDNDLECCSSAVVDANGTCCPGGSVLDNSGDCCSSSDLDACGQCNGSGLFYDVLGACCTSIADASGICCQVSYQLFISVGLQARWLQSFLLQPCFHLTTICQDIAFEIPAAGTFIAAAQADHANTQQKSATETLCCTILLLCATSSLCPGLVQQQSSSLSEQLFGHATVSIIPTSCFHRAGVQPETLQATKQCIDPSRQGFPTSVLCISTSRPSFTGWVDVCVPR